MTPNNTTQSAKGRFSGDGREIIQNIHNFLKFNLEGIRRQGGSGPFDGTLGEVTARMTGVSERTVYRISKENKEPSSITFNTELRRKHRKRWIPLDDLTKSLIRRKIQEFYTLKKELPTVKKLLYCLKSERILDCGREALRKYLRLMGYSWRKCQAHRALLVEKPEIAQLRVNYLREIRKLRAEGRNIVYLDETYLYVSHHMSRFRSNKDEKSLAPGTAKGNRLLVCHAGGEKGFVKNCLLMMVFKSKNGDFQEDMNFDIFSNWVTSQLLPNLEPKSVVVMDNATYHCVKRNKTPTIANLKVDIQKWLSDNGISFPPNATKNELLILVKNNSQESTFKIDDLIKSKGHTVLHLPPYHADLNPIELVWRFIKGKSDLNSTLSGKLDKCKSLFSNYTTERWKKSVETVIKLEEEYWKNEKIIDAVIDSLIINLGCLDSDGQSQELDSDLDSTSSEEQLLEEHNQNLPTKEHDDDLQNREEYQTHQKDLATNSQNRNNRKTTVNPAKRPSNQISGNSERIVNLQTNQISSPKSENPQSSLRNNNKEEFSKAILSKSSKKPQSVESNQQNRISQIVDLPIIQSTNTSVTNFSNADSISVFGSQLKDNLQNTVPNENINGLINVLNENNNESLLNVLNDHNDDSFLNALTDHSNESLHGSAINQGNSNLINVQNVHSNLNTPTNENLQNILRTPPTEAHQTLLNGFNTHINENTEIILSIGNTQNLHKSNQDNPKIGIILNEQNGQNNLRTPNNENSQNVLSTSNNQILSNLTNQSNQNLVNVLSSHTNVNVSSHPNHTRLQSNENSLNNRNLLTILNNQSNQCLQAVLNFQNNQSNLCDDSNQGLLRVVSGEKNKILRPILNNQNPCLQSSFCNQNQVNKLQNQVIVSPTNQILQNALSTETNLGLHININEPYSPSQSPQTIFGNNNVKKLQRTMVFQHPSFPSNLTNLKRRVQRDRNSNNIQNCSNDQQSISNSHNAQNSSNMPNNQSYLNNQSILSNQSFTHNPTGEINQNIQNNNFGSNQSCRVIENYSGTQTNHKLESIQETNRNIQLYQTTEEDQTNPMIPSFSKRKDFESLYSPISEKRVRVDDSHTTEAIQCIKTLNEAFSKRDEYTIYGEHIANKLRNCCRPKLEIAVAQHEIDNVCFQLTMGTLSQVTDSPVPSILSIHSMKHSPSPHKRHTRSPITNGKSPSTPNNFLPENILSPEQT